MIDWESAICNRLAEAPASAGEISRSLGVTPTPVYEQMKFLVDVGLVEILERRKHTRKGGRPVKIFTLARTKRTA